MVVPYLFEPPQITQSGAITHTPPSALDRSLFVTLLCLSSGVFELFEELAGDVALEAAPDLAVGSSFASPPVGVGAGCGVGAEPGERDGVEGPVELAVAGSVEAVFGGQA